MPEPKSKTKKARASVKKDDSHQQRVFESESVALQSFRLVAAPKPEDDLSDAELAKICKDPSTSSDLIRHLIDCIKSI
jgi:hypothetical protein